jgi:hypothetical protein
VSFIPVPCFLLTHYFFLSIWRTPTNDYSRIDLVGIYSLSCYLSGNICIPPLFRIALLGVVFFMDSFFIPLPSKISSHYHQKSHPIVSWCSRFLLRSLLSGSRGTPMCHLFLFSHSLENLVIFHHWELDYKMS